MRYTRDQPTQTHRDRDGRARRIALTGSPHAGDLNIDDLPEEQRMRAVQDVSLEIEVVLERGRHALELSLRDAIAVKDEAAGLLVGCLLVKYEVREDHLVEAGDRLDAGILTADLGLANERPIGTSGNTQQDDENDAPSSPSMSRQWQRRRMRPGQRKAATSQHGGLDLPAGSFRSMGVAHGSSPRSRRSVGDVGTEDDGARRDRQRRWVKSPIAAS